MRRGAGTALLCTGTARGLGRVNAKPLVVPASGHLRAAFCSSGVYLEPARLHMKLSWEVAKNSCVDVFVACMISQGNTEGGDLKTAMTNTVEEC